MTEINQSTATLKKRLFGKTPCCDLKHTPVKRIKNHKDYNPIDEYESKHSLLKDKENLKCFNEDGTKKGLWQMMVTPASVTTMEAKYFVVPFVAEFYCTITSIFFCAPILIYSEIPYSLVPPIQRACIILSCITALASFGYHMTIWKVLSSVDAGLATATMFLNAYSLVSAAWPPHHWLNHHLSWQVPLTGIVILFVWNWERTSVLSVRMILVIFPFAMYGYAVNACWMGLALGVLGLSSFAIDRKNWLPGHSIWHLAGGLSLWSATHSATVRNLPSSSSIQ
ncbi:hypothetical protein SeMB42_g06520 [Synchytrium endobioticum]|nr:hypothetical protein SeMB42_g06520 [Synchytrium endobioticum]